jgi:hypothetical protein
LQIALAGLADNKGLLLEWFNRLFISEINKSKNPRFKLKEILWLYRIY